MGLIDVMMALAILMFSVFAISEGQVTALAGVHASGFHFALDRLSGEMSETLRAHRANALAGEFDHGTDTAPVPTTSGGRLADAWRARAANAIAGSSTGIDCDDTVCDLVIEWTEEIDGTPRRQRFRTATPLRGP